MCVNEIVTSLRDKKDMQGLASLINLKTSSHHTFNIEQKSLSLNKYIY